MAHGSRTLLTVLAFSTEWTLIISALTCIVKEIKHSLVLYSTRSHSLSEGYYRSEFGKSVIVKVESAQENKIS